MNKYELILENENGKKETVYEAESLKEIDYFTSQFNDKDDLLNKANKRFNSNYNKVYINGTIKDNKYQYNDIMYNGYYIPKDEELITKFLRYIYEDKLRINESYLRHMPFAKVDNMDNIPDRSIEENLRSSLKGYKKKRDCYFILVNNNRIKITPEKVKEEDYLSSLINSADISDDDFSIIIQDIQNGTIEPTLYDLEDYERHSKKRR